MPYPDQIDLVWLAVDRAGGLAAFITGGSGPVPEPALAKLDEADVEAALMELPIIGEAWLCVELPNPESFKALSERGLFVYDWTDVHRTDASAIGDYELVAKPSVPLHYDILPTALRTVASPLSEAAFGATRLKI